MFFVRFTDATTSQTTKRQVKNLEDVVLQFTLGRGDVLLATSIIENGIDMPNVNSIVVMVGLHTRLRSPRLTSII